MQSWSETDITFTGDIGFDKYMKDKWADEELLSPAVLDFVRDTNHLVVNVEGPLSEGEKQLKEGAVVSLTHSMDPNAVSFLNRINADVWNICNNHIMDAGPKGIEDTILLSQQNHARTLGAGMNIDEARKPVIIDEAGGVGMIGVGYQRACRKADVDVPGCFSWSDMDGIKAAIGEIKKTCRWCVVVAHGGEEFTALPMPYTRDRYLEYLNLGADIVVGHHPHVPMNYETVGDKVIFYSLGNFVFDTDYQRSQFNTEFGIIVKLHFTTEAFSFIPFGIKVNRENNRIEECELPDIFTDVNDKEYDKLKSLAAKMFIENTKRQLKYLKPDKFKDASEDDFVEDFYIPLRSGRVPGEVLDMQIVYPLSKEWEKGEWKNSKLDKVKEFMLRQIPER